MSKDLKDERLILRNRQTNTDIHTDKQKDREKQPQTQSSGETNILELSPELYVLHKRPNP